MTSDGYDGSGSFEPPQEPNFWQGEQYQRPNPSPYPSQEPHPGPDYWYPPEEQRYAAPTQQWAPVQQRKPRRAVAGLAAAAVLAIAIGGAVIGFSSGGSHTPTTSSFATPQSPSTSEGGSSSGSQTSPYSGGSGSGSEGQTSPFGGFGSGNGTGSGSSGTTTTGQKATTSQQVGIVDINTTIDYGQEEAAGTGMVLTASGEILTNNHVVNGATKISVTIVSTGKTYTASVVGTDPTDDVAVIQLSNASGLAKAKIGDSSTVKVGNAVTAVGNAGGTGGVPSSASGSVTALNQTITAGDESGSDSETLTGMIQTNADVQAGDSGGPLYSSSGSIIGMDTAASTSTQTAATGFAIPINKATTIANEIESGSTSSKIHLGNAGFLGVELSEDSGLASSGAAISGVIANSAAANAGLTSGDTITAVNGKSVADAAGLTTAISAYKSGQEISLSWSDTSGQSHTATVTLGTGPAD